MRQLFIDLIAYLKATTAVSSLVGSRVYTMLAPENETAPYLVLSVISANTGMCHDASDQLTYIRLQIDVYANTVDDLLKISDALKISLHHKNGLQGSTKFGYIKYDNETDFYNKETTLKQKSIDFLILKEE